MIAEQVALAEQVGLSTSRLKRIDALVEAFIERGIIAGAVTLVARKGRIAHLVAHGQMDIAAARPMQSDTIFRLASMTKPVIGVAIMMLLEEGRLLLQEPLSNYLPAFKRLHVAVPNPQLPAYVPTELPAGEFHLVPANREVTLRDLLTHTSGVGSATSGPAVEAMVAVAQQAQTSATLEDVVPEMAAVPLSFQPGTAWEYSPAFGFDILARVVEIVSGLTIDRFLQQRVFEPLGMVDTSFSVPPEKMTRVATVYDRGQAGLQIGTPIRALALSTDPHNRYYSGGGGLAGTAEDYSRFARMLANGGQLDGQRLVSRKSVELMASNHIGQLPFDRAPFDMRGYRFGLSVRVLDSPAEAASLASRGAFGWSGAFGTQVLMDPVENMVMSLLIQRLPATIDNEVRALWPRLQATAFQSIED